jgi:hypothetical protein
MPQNPVWQVKTRDFSPHKMFMNSKTVLCHPMGAVVGKAAGSSLHFRGKNSWPHPFIFVEKAAGLFPSFSWKKQLASSLHFRG